MSRDYLLQPFRPPVKSQIDYTGALNPQQLAAVTAPPGPALVIAGAGAGKTRTLIYRVAYLLEQGVAPSQVLLLTFTNKAAREMMRRAADLLGHDLDAVWGGTFHAVGYRILRQHAERIGYRTDFTILDREDARDLMRACMSEAAIEPQAGRFPKADVVCEILSLAANTQQPLAETVARHFDYFQGAVPRLQDLEQRYQARKRAANVMDFDDLLVQWLRLLQTQAEVREYYQRRFQFLLVDEYQDTNALQAELIDLLAARHRNVMVVGDDAQSIYSWRGANLHNLLEFPRRYPGASVYKIETNYRSTPEILSLANAAIKANVQQFAKDLVPVRRSGDKPALVVCADAGQQAAFVAQRLVELREAGSRWNEVAVLYRSHFHALELQLELTRRQIPFSITSGIRFFEQAHLKDLVAHLKLACNPADELAFKRVVQLLPGVGAKGADRLWQQFAAATRPGGDQASGPVTHALQTCARLVPKKAAEAWAQLAATLTQLQAPDLRRHPDQLIRTVLEAGYDEYLKATYENYPRRKADLEELAAFALQFASLEEFLAQLALLTNLEAEEDRPPATDQERVRLSTIHQAKGLEFDVVFVIMLCEGLFPNARSLQRPEDEEEERRLFYVALTRARNQLYLTYPLLRSLRSAQDGGFLQPSRFLGEIPAELLEEWNLVSGAGWA